MGYKFIILGYGKKAQQNSNFIVNNIYLIFKYYELKELIKI
jgi:hypothetical protein